ncbi:MAG: FAD-binding protein [Ruminococcaceae bacterium]|nr:FAD-binding protein [Oscillospiraceae bacterium]
MCKRRFDVAVIGAGPAGAIFASELAKLRPELTMLVIDGQSEQNKKVCGGLLAPDAQKVLASFDLTLPNAILADPQIFAVDTLDLSSGQRQVYQRHYLNMNRYLFDRWLTARIPSHVTVLSAHCDDIREEDGGYTVTVGGTVYRADSIVGADGANSTVRKTLIGAAPKQYTAIQEWYRMNSAELPHYSCIFDRTTSDSCSWTICKDGYWIFGGAFEKHGCRDAFAAQKLHLQQTLGCTFGEPIRREACLLTSPRHWRDFLCGRPGVYLIGEAGGFISASSFEGISAAMLCGRYLAQAFAAGRIKSDIWRRYCRLTFPLRLKLWSKTVKRALLCSPFFRYWIMKSGLQSIKPEPNRSIFTQLPPVC